MDKIGSQANDALTSPAAQRNREPIAEVLRQVLPETGRVLEIASGSGEHALHFAAGFPTLEWLPSDASPEARRSIAAWRRTAGLGNLAEPLALDVTSDWPVEAPLAAIVCINMLHISPWSASEALFAGAGRTLGEGAPLIVYGPFRKQGQHTAASNARFDADLRARDASWGIRDLEAVDALAETAGLVREADYSMPANNACLVWRRRAC
ncbi:DUF938 domain-containing protein [Salinicola aestuarinus]|uniref:DUF938 domain-containing protein n=1 Tax=Salinicola aestuarinus TaxID=1949082 RepID=UPI000DA12A1C|nr:DUF938 domain-containing protein [Salinicola aestuarinus]